MHELSHPEIREGLEKSQWQETSHIQAKRRKKNLTISAPTEAELASAARQILRLAEVEPEGKWMAYYRPRPNF